MIFYKIRHRTTGKFRLAGGEPRWNHSGKVFDSIGKLRFMITNCINHNLYKNHVKNDFSEWEIVEYEVSELSTKSVSEIVKADVLIRILKS